MISANKILKEINDYNLVKLNLDDNYNFEKSDNAYLIKKGSILSFGDNNFTQLMGEHDPVGFSEVILAKKKLLKYKLLTDIELFSFSGIRIRKEVNNCDVVMKSIIKYSLARIFGNSKSKGHYLLEDEFITKYQNFFRKFQYVKGDQIFVCDQEPRGMYFIEKGSVSLYTKNDKFITKLVESESFGESALISGKLRNNTAIAECDTLLIEVNSEILDKRIAKETPLVKLTLLSILRRLELMNKLRMPSDFNS